MPTLLNHTGPRAHTRREGLPRRLGQVVWKTFDAGFRFRVMGLAAETAFFALLSLPPLLFGLAGSIGYIAAQFDVTAVAAFRHEILRLGSRFLAPDAINGVLAPTLDDVLSRGRFEFISIGFLLSLWSGSRAIAVFVDTCTIMYGMRGRRGIVRSRALAFLIYAVLLVAMAILLPLVLAGPRLIGNLLPDSVAFVVRLYWPIVGVGTIALVAGLFRTAMPIRRRWGNELPGAVLTVGCWLGGSWALRVFLIDSLASASLYGPLAAPIAIMMWLYLVAISALIGAAFNASIAAVFPSFAGLTQTESDQVLEDAPPAP